MQDGLGRKIEYLRVSVTDRCNLRCRYCMPQEGIGQFAHADCLTLEEIYRIVAVMADMGLRKVRFTGGEPMVRKNLVKLVGDVAGLWQIRNVALTTNGVLFADQAEEFAGAGLTAVNISLDTLDSKTFSQITGKDEIEKVLRAIEKSLKLGLKVKINCVPARELNGMADGRTEASYLRVAELARNYPVDVRFIELMPIGCGREFTRITGEETLRALEEQYGHVVQAVRKEVRDKVQAGAADIGRDDGQRSMRDGRPGSAQGGEQDDGQDSVKEAGQSRIQGGEQGDRQDDGQDSVKGNRQNGSQNGPARYVQFPGFQGRIGFIDPLSHKFCSECNRVRLTVDGRLKLCLYYADGIDLKRMLRDGATDGEIRAAIEQALRRKPKEHHFGKDSDGADGENIVVDSMKNTDNEETEIPDGRRMVQIGG